MRLAAHAGLSVAEVDRTEFEGISVLICPGNSGDS